MLQADDVHVWIMDARLYFTKWYIFWRLNKLNEFEIFSSSEHNKRLLNHITELNWKSQFYKS